MGHEILGDCIFRLDIGCGSVAVFGSSKCMGVHGRIALVERVDTRSNILYDRGPERLRCPLSRSSQAFQCPDLFQNSQECAELDREAQARQFRTRLIARMSHQHGST